MVVTGGATIDRPQASFHMFDLQAPRALQTPGNFHPHEASNSDDHISMKSTYGENGLGLLIIARET